MTLLAAAALSVAAIGCSSDGDGGTSTEVSAEGQPYVDAIARAFTSQSAGGLTLEKDSALCISAKWVNIITPAKLEESGVDPTALATSNGTDPLAEIGLGKDQAETMVDGFDECGVDLREVFLKTVREDENSNEATKKCVEGQIDEKLIRNLLVESLTSSAAELENSPIAGQFLAVMVSCAGDLSSPGG